MKTRAALRMLLAALFLAVVFAVVTAQAGGPLKVAGVSGFDPGVVGLPVTWQDGAIHYYTDQGNLSAVLTKDDADAMVADAFSRWTSISTAAVSATKSGQLDEDVSGQNVTGSANGTINLPSDIQPSATNKPVAIIYDADGTVTDALLGEGAGDAEMCSTNAVYGGPDNYSSDAHYSHALVVINGNCAQSVTDIPNVRYELVRVLGRVLGLDWSDLNENVVTGSPPPTDDDRAGFPLMHAMEPVCWNPPCVPNADQPKMDDRAALSRLYPASGADQRLLGNSFPNDAPITNTARVHGSVYFTNADGSNGQAMQGAKVVARWIDPATGLPSNAHELSSVSGFLFRGNAGNPVTGYVAPGGGRYDQLGSSDISLEGFFDLAGLEFPDGSDTAQYQVTVEPVDPMCAQTMAVGPYRDSQVLPSGSASPVLVTLTKGMDLGRDMLMADSASAVKDVTSSFTDPAQLPASGEWVGSLSGYGNIDYFLLSATEKRTMTVQVTALDENGSPSQVKALPVIGIWAASDSEGSAPQTGAYYFNTGEEGLTSLDAEFLATRAFKIAIADFRGDGRPDFQYHAKILYGDRVTPSRPDVQGKTPLTIRGLGFRNGITATVGGVPANVTGVSPTELVISAPPAADGTDTITLQNVDGTASSLIDSVTYGADSTDRILLEQGGNPWTPVGGQTVYPFRAKVVQADGVTPVPGATVSFTSSPPDVQFAACGATMCNLVSDAQGEVISDMNPTASGSTTVIATLANGASINTTVASYETALDIAVFNPRKWLRQGTTGKVALTARVLSNGAPLSGQTVNFQMTQGNATISPAAVKTGADGFARTNLNVSNIANEVDVSACVAPKNAPCQSFYIAVAPDSSLRCEIISGADQIINTSQTFQPLLLRLVDSSTPPNAVQMATVTFESDIFRWQPAIVPSGGMTIPRRPQRTLLSTWRGPVVSDAEGILTFTPSPGADLGAVFVDVTASAGNAVQQLELTKLWAPGSDGADSSSQPRPKKQPVRPVKPPRVLHPILPRLPVSSPRYPPID